MRSPLTQRTDAFYDRIADAYAEVVTGVSPENIIELACGGVLTSPTA